VRDEGYQKSILGVAILSWMTSKLSYRAKRAAIMCRVAGKWIDYVIIFIRAEKLSHK